MPYPVKWYTYDFAGVPDLGAPVAGGLIGILKACLVDGFNDQVPTTMTFAGDEITIDFGAPGHGFLWAQIVEVTGADQSEYNGEHRVSEVSTNWIKVKPESTPGVGTATTASAFGCRTPPVGGWSTLYYDAPTHNIIFGRTDAASTEYKLRIYNDQSYDTSGGLYGCYHAKIEILEDYVDDLTHTIHSTRYWPAAYTYSDVGAYWSIFADKLMFYWNNRYAQNEGNDSCLMFGDINSVIPYDTGHCITNQIINTGTSARWENEGYDAHFPFAQHKLTSYRYMMKDYSQGGATSWSTQGPDTYMANSISYPNPGTNGFFIWKGPMPLLEGTTIVRGYLPGVMQPLHRNSYYWNRVIDQFPGLEGVPAICWPTSCSTKNDRGAYGRMCAWRLDDWRTG